MKQLKNHVSAAKEWLGRAERSLEEDNEIQGNLNVMLAQAELRHAQEAKQTKKKWYLLIHSMLITSILGMVLVIGLGGFDAFSEKAIKKVPTSDIEVNKSSVASLPLVAKEVALPQNDAKDDVDKQSVEVVQYEAVTDASTSQSKEVVQQVYVEEPVRQELKVTSAQMQHLLRAAGKSLRGQE